MKKERIIFGLAVILNCFALFFALELFFQWFGNVEFFIFGFNISVLSVVFYGITLENVLKGKIKLSKSLVIILFIISLIITLLPLIIIVWDIFKNGLHIAGYS
jgi:hypothetical protein